MQIEHLLYSIAIAIIAGMIHFKRTGRDYSWIIIASAFAPDIDIIINTLLYRLGLPVLMDESGINHGDFHSLTMLVIFAIIVSIIMQVKKYRFFETFIFAAIGYGAHLFEDALVFDPGYAFLKPLSNRIVGIGLFDYYPDIYRFADSSVLILGIFLVLVAAAIRISYEGKDWIKKETKTVAVILLLMIIAILTYGTLDISFIDKITQSKDGVFLDYWYFGDDGSWDSTIAHSGNYSGKISIAGNESKISGMWRTRSIPVNPNTTYVFSSWGKTESAYGANTPAVRIVELDSSKIWIKQTNLVFERGTNNWTQKTTWLRTTNNTYWVYIYANIWEGYGTFWFDDVELYEKGRGPNLLPDPGIEKGYVINLITRFDNYFKP